MLSTKISKKVVHDADNNIIVVKTSGMSGTENANEELLPEDEDGIFETPSTGYVGGVDKLELSAFSEKINEILASVEEIKTNSNGNMSVTFDSGSEILPTLRFREKYDNCKAVVTNRERL